MRRSFYHDLFVTKDEAVRLLVRLKQMLDAKTIEAEIISSDKQGQIDLLEAQLHEAEDIVIALRSELRCVEEELEKAVVNKEQRQTEKVGEENLSSVNRRCLVLSPRARNAEVIPEKPSNELGIKKRRKLQGRRKRRWGGKRKATAVRSQSQLIKPCQSQSDIPCSKTSVENSDDKDSMDTQLSVENEEVDDLNACKGLEEHLQHCADGIGIIRKRKRSKNVDNLGAVNPTDHLVSVNVEDEENRADIPENGTKIKPLPRLDPGLTSVNSNVDLTLGSTNATIISVNATNGSTDKDS